MRGIITVGGLALCGLIMSCGETTQQAADVPNEASNPTTKEPAPADVKVVDEEEADLHLWISNQSFADDPVEITVQVDGVEVVDEPFDVESQHNWVLFPLELSPGRHVVTATSDTGAEFRQEFRTPKNHDDRYAVLDYWNYEDKEGRHFTWMVQREPVAFM
jgi:hypothetical protein